MGFSDETTETAALFVSAGTEVAIEAYRQGLMPPAIAAVSSYCWIYAPTMMAKTTTAVSAVSTYGGAAARLAMYTARPYVASAISSAGTVVSGTALATAAAAGVVVGGGMIAYTEYVWSGIEGEKRIYLEDWRDRIAPRLFEECMRSGGNEKLCGDWISRKAKEESARYDRDLLTGNECPWYSAIFCRG